MKVLLAGGGTGGHIYPAVTLAKGLLAEVPDCDILFVGTAQGLEADIVPKEGFRFTTIDVQGFQRKLSWDTLVSVGRLTKSLVQSCKILRAYRPDVVIGTGGYVCGPVVLSAKLLGIPAAIQEQNVIPGITNKILARFVDLVAVGYEEAIRYFPPQAKVIATGNPVRPAILQAERKSGLQSLGLDPAKKTVLIAGGSRGARAINEAMLQVYQDFKQNNKIQFLHITGSGEFEALQEKIRQLGIGWEKKGNIRLIPYLYNMPDAMAAADLIVYRAGAIGLAEIAVRGLPALLIPYPYAAENHQELNARLFERQGAAVVILDRELTGERLSSTLGKLLSQPEELAAMAKASQALGRPWATRDIIKRIIALT